MLPEITSKYHCTMDLLRYAAAAAAENRGAQPLLPPMSAARNKVPLISHEVHLQFKLLHKYVYFASYIALLTYLSTGSKGNNKC